MAGDHTMHLAHCYRQYLLHRVCKATIGLWEILSLRYCDRIVVGCVHEPINKFVIFLEKQKSDFYETFHRCSVSAPNFTTCINFSKFKVTTAAAFPTIFHGLLFQSS